MSSTIDQKYEDVRDYFGSHIWLLKIAGMPLRPIDIKNIFLRYMYYAYSFSFIMLFVIIYSITEGMEAFLHNLEDIDKLSFHLSYFLTHFLGSIKVILFILKRRKLVEQIDKLETGIMRPDYKRGGDVEYKYIKAANKQINFQAYFFYAVVISVLGNRAVYVIITNSSLHTNGNQTMEKTTAFYTWVPFEYQQSPKFEIVFAYQLFSCWVYGFFIGAIDTILTGFMIHIKCQCLILKNSIRRYNLLEETNGDDNNIKNSYLAGEPLHQRPQILVNINNCIRHHHEIMKFAETVESEFSLLMLMQFLCSLSLVCFQLFQLSVSDLASFRFFSMLSYLVLMLFELLVYCWNGTEVMIHSGTISDAIYESNWIVSEEKVKKSLLLMMLGANRPLKLTAAKFAILSLPAYMNIVKGSASYFMFLKQMNN